MRRFPALACLASLITLAATACLMSGAARADWVTVSSSGDPVLSVCNPKTGTGDEKTQSPTLTTCKVDGLPGSAAVPGYTQIRSTSADIVVNVLRALIERSAIPGPPYSTFIVACARLIRAELLNSALYLRIRGSANDPDVQPETPEPRALHPLLLS